MNFGDSLKHMNFDTPWGKLESPTAQQLVEFWIKQCEWHQPDPKKRSEHCKRDIAGYQLLLKATEDTVFKFLEHKNTMKRATNKIVDNLNVVESMKRKGLWDEVPSA